MDGGADHVRQEYAPSARPTRTTHLYDVRLDPIIGNYLLHRFFSHLILSLVLLRLVQEERIEDRKLSMSSAGPF